MKTIYDKLRAAQIDELLINAFQKDSDIVYTGIIQYLSSKDFIMITYNDYGLQDGEVYLKISSVKRLETDSYDLASMKERIAFDEKHHMAVNPPFDMPIKMSDSLFDRVLKTLHEDQRVSLIITKNFDELKYNEGLISEIQADGIAFQNINKYDFSKRPKYVIKFADIRGIEFGGTELQLLQNTLELIKPANHTDDVVITDQNQFKTRAMQLRTDQSWLIIDTNDGRKYFYVGKIIANNQSELVMLVVDMNGRFGGYVWIRYDDIRRIIVDADYLRVVEKFVAANQKAKHFALPVLNAERAFDNADNMLVNIIMQAINYRNIIRFETDDQENFVGYPTAFDLQTGVVTVELLDVDDDGELQIKQVGIETVREMAFDYLKAYLAENEVD
ncbi:hypothetical protein [Lentilactobacillus kisonensis]|uniref:Uncharacterized protein n=2 Tax=Lentilactobacillus kisonensis TaxID=481722 RepID=H1LJU8_9LACO|nr:hypothetical protein [Lentilactobacillus kisonensis]EHO48247.1 hypothetical protein HMPREF9104_02890 [Lentilactobacillus kisonensis F0435]KRL22984.1 hypothetical protein FC98_GL001014 [Lentilactobacillus kisonensis DSM 19906 = JCM 15041]